MKVYIGDITKTPVDVIVNAADTDFTPGGGVARWIKKEGGKKIFDEATKFAPGEVGRSYMTNAGKLSAKAVIHIPTVDWKNNVKLSLPEVNQSAVVAMNMAIDKGYKSITFPLMASGTVGLLEEEVASELSDAIVHMEKDFTGFEGSISVLNRQVYEKIKPHISSEHELIEL